MDTIKIDHPNTRLIAHRGASYLERENTMAAFIAAGNRSYYGIETDVHRTSDGKFVLIHDDTTARVAGGVDFLVEGTSFDVLRGVQLYDIGGIARADLVIPTPEEYFGVCKRYDKTAVFELKNPFEEEDIQKILAVVHRSGWFSHTIFISFYLQNLQLIRKFSPNANVQFLYEDRITKALVDVLVKENMGLDVRHDRLHAHSMAMLKEHNIQVNCWTVDSALEAKRLIKLGVDFITTNRLE